MFRPARTINSWMDALEEIKDLREEYQRNAQIMTPYERQAVESYIGQRRRANRDQIARGMVQAFNVQVATYEAAKKRIEDERRKEINRWDPGRLTAEMQLAEMRVKAIMARNSRPGDDPTGELAAVFAEARESGDQHKQRAAAEVMAGALGAARTDDPTARMRLNRIAQQAHQALQEIRITPGMLEAEQVRETAEGQLLDLHRGLDRTAQILGYGDAMRAHGPLSSAYERLNRDENGALVIGPDKERSEWVEEFYERIGER